MTRPGKLHILLVVACIFRTSIGFCQLDKILKAGEKVLEKSPSKLTEKYFSNAPVTTSFDDAKTEVMLLGQFDPPEDNFLPLHMLRQNANGNYIVRPGLYTAWNKSFCLKAGTHGPRGGDGHLYAPLAGPKAYLVRNLLENWQTRAPNIPQTDVQCVIWAIIARTDVDKMQPKYKAVLAQLLDKEDIAQLATNSLRDKALDAGMTKFKNEIPPSIYKVYEAESRLRSMYSKADASYEQFEGFAILAGMAPAADMIRPVSKARWSWHPNGYFIRLTPQGYSNTKVDVYIPMGTEALMDSLGRIQFIHDGHKTVEFVYDDNIIPQYEAFRSGLAGIKFYADSMTISVALAGLAPSFINNGFSFAEKDVSFGTELWKYTDWLNGAKKGLNMEVALTDKTKLFNLANIIGVIGGLPADSLQGFQPYLLFILNEAHNYLVYQNLSEGTGNASIGNPVVPSQPFLVVTATPANNTGPYATDADDLPGTTSTAWFKLDNGELDLPNSVATPANRSSQRIGQSKPPKKKPWYEPLPPCPCTYKEAQDSAKRAGSGWLDCGAASQTYHYGATNEVRWAGKSGDPGQQCTYDSNGDLITSGIAAGSPDKVSPQTCGDLSWNMVVNVPQHYKNDVYPYGNVPCSDYLKDWPSNNANKCAPANPVNDITHMKKLVGNMTCLEISEMLDAAAKSTTIDPALKNFLFGTGNMTDQQATTELTNWKKGDKNAPGDVIDKAVGNLKPAPAPNR